MRASAWIAPLCACRPDGVGVAEWSLYVGETRRVTLQTKDRETGNAHVPLTLTDSAGGRYLLLWEDGRISRGSLERHELQQAASGTPGASR